MLMTISLLGLSAVALRAESKNPGVPKKSQRSTDFSYQVMTLGKKDEKLAKRKLNASQKFTC